MTKSRAVSAYTTRELLASGSQGQTAVTESVALLHTAPVNTLDTLDLFNAGTWRGLRSHEVVVVVVGGIYT